MARRSGQNGVIEKKGNFWYGRYYEDVAGQEARRRCAVRLGLTSEFTRSAAKRMLKDHIHAAGVNTAEHLQNSRLFKDQADWWVINKLSFAKQSTQDVSQIHLRAYINPFFGTLSLADITEEKVQEFVSRLARTTYKRTVNGPEHRLSAKTIRNILGVLKLVLGKKHWRDWSLTLPKPTPHEQRWLTVDEMKAIIGAAKGKEKVLFSVLANTGMRAGEAFGLYVQDIDFEHGQIHIRRSMYKGREGTPKSAAGYRIVDVDSALLQLLKDYIEPRCEGRIFSTRNGRPLQKDSVRKSLFSILRKLGLPKAGLHSFRHGRVSMLRMAGVPDDLTKTWIGHSNLRVTSGYTHFDSAFRARVANACGISVSIGPNRPNGAPSIGQ